MIELVYPQTLAPIVKGQRACNASDMLPIVEDSGLVIAQAPRTYCHSGAKVLHPVVHLHIINRRGELYLQQRSRHKDLLPSYWDTAVGGHISYGEYVNEALHREAEEELKLLDFTPIFIDSYVFESAIERELVNVFATVGDFALSPDPIELDGGRFWTEKQLASKLGKNVFTPNFEQEYSRLKSSIFAIL